jgi:D-alanyl-lipoteichoic acid acyltransferase DltB (MBOAT superfamily)
MNLTAPAVLLSTTSLLLLAYTNRFLAISALVRDLSAKHREHPQRVLSAQIKSLLQRINLIRDMQALGVLSLLFVVLSMFLIFTESQKPAQIIFGCGLVLLMISLTLSTYEIYISTHALNIELKGLEDLKQEE